MNRKNNISRDAPSTASGGAYQATREHLVALSVTLDDKTKLVGALEER